MLVELDIFSGKANPRWQLDQRTVKALVGLLRRLKRSSVPSVEPPGLGYRGFSWADERQSGRAYKGFVRVARATVAAPWLSN
jgi:hypothetical protein